MFRAKDSLEDRNRDDFILRTNLAYFVSHSRTSRTKSYICKRWTVTVSLDINSNYRQKKIAMNMKTECFNRWKKFVLYLEKGVLERQRNEENIQKEQTSRK